MVGALGCRRTCVLLHHTIAPCGPLCPPTHRMVKKLPSDLLIFSLSTLTKPVWGKQGCGGNLLEDGRGGITQGRTALQHSTAQHSADPRSPAAPLTVVQPVPDKLVSRLAAAVATAVVVAAAAGP